MLWNISHRKFTDTLPRVLSVTPGRHHKPFESARTARGLHVASVPSIWSERSTHFGAQKSERRGAREKGVDQDGRTVRDWHQRNAGQHQDIATLSDKPKNKLYHTFHSGDSSARSIL